MQARTPIKMENEKMNVRDYITMGIILVLIFIIYVAIGTPIGMTVVGNLFPFAICSLLWGTLFLLLYTKIPKKGLPLLSGLILALFQLTNFWAISVVMVIGALLNEFLWQKLNRSKFSTMLLCFTIQITFWYLGMFIPLIFLKDLYIAALPAYEQLYSRVFDLIVGPMFFVGLIATILGCLIGAFLGKILLKKHFARAGVV